MVVLAGCATAGRTVAGVPLDQRLEALYGHRMDVAERNTQWENERLRLRLAVDRYVEQHPATPASVAETLRRGDVVPGLTKEQVRLLWGPPTRVKHGARPRMRCGSISCRTGAVRSARFISHLPTALSSASRPDRHPSFSRDSSGSRAQD